MIHDQENEPSAYYPPPVAGSSNVTALADALQSISTAASVVANPPTAYSYAYYDPYALSSNKPNIGRNTLTPQLNGLVLYAQSAMISVLTLENGGMVPLTI